MLSIGHYVMNIGYCMLFTLVFVSILKNKSPSSLSHCCCAVYFWMEILQLTLIHAVWFLNDCSCHIWCGFYLGVWNTCWLMFSETFLQCLKLLEVATSPFRVHAWLTSYKGKFIGSLAVRGTYVCIDTTSPNEDTTSPGAKTTSFLDTTSL